MDEPPEELRKAIDDMEKDEIVNGRIHFDVLGHGETIAVEKENAISTDMYDSGLTVNLISPSIPVSGIIEIPNDDHDDDDELNAGSIAVS